MEINADILQYVEGLCSCQSQLLDELQEFTFAEVYNPVMISSEYQGRLLSFFSQLKRPKKALEIGTYTGFSALCLAEGLAPEGKLITIERNPNMLGVARSFFERSAYANQIQGIEGEAIEMLKANTDQQFDGLDLVFIDANKKAYKEYVDLIFPMMNTGGVMIIDNVLWKGKVIKSEEIEHDLVTKSLSLFNKYISEVYADRLTPMILPIRDGITVGIKH